MSYSSATFFSLLPRHTLIPLNIQLIAFTFFFYLLYKCLSFPVSFLGTIYSCTSLPFTLSTVLYCSIYNGLVPVFVEYNMVVTLTTANLQLTRNINAHIRYGA